MVPEQVSMSSFVFVLMYAYVCESASKKVCERESGSVTGLTHHCKWSATTSISCLEYVNVHLCICSKDIHYTFDKIVEI